MHSTHFREAPEYPSHRSQQAQPLPPQPLSSQSPASAQKPHVHPLPHTNTNTNAHAHTHTHVHVHSTIGHRVGVGQPARPQVPPLPHLHELMAQSQRERVTESSPVLAPSYQFSSAATRSSGSGHIGRDNSSYSNRLAPATYTASTTSGNLYPSTLFPSHHIQAQHQPRHPHQQQQQLQKPPQHRSSSSSSSHHHHQQQQQQEQTLPSHSANGAPVKLLQSCDSCRRRKIRCSGEKPTCSACIRYQELCHYSPLATPRRRVGKRARLAMESAAATTDTGAKDLRDAPTKEAEPSTQPSPAAAPTPLARESAADTPPAFSEESEVGMLRQELRALTRKFDALSEKMDLLLNAMHRKRRLRHRRRMLSQAVNGSERASTSDIDVDMQSGSSDADDTYSDSSGADSGNEQEGHSSDGQHEEAGHEFGNLIDKTSRFGIDATNIGVISDMINSMSKRDGSSAESVRVTAASDPFAGTKTSTVPTMAGFIGTLEAAEMQKHLLDTFFLHADVGMISFIPRQIFQRLQRENRTPTSMVNVMLAEACNYSSASELAAVGRATARGYFIERAYRALFECLEYDSAEHCVAILLFALVISKAGLHRAWIMHSLSTQMAIRLRFNTLDSPLSAPAFRNDTALTREWKRRVFWQLYTYDILTSTLSDLPPCLAIRDIRCNSPTPMTSASDDLAVLGPAVVFCDDQETTGLQIELLGILCDISALQSRLSPEECLFPPQFSEMHDRIAAWRTRMPHMDTLVSGSLADIADVFANQPSLVFLGLMCQYARIFLCFIKDTWLPSTRKMTPQEENTLAWARQTAFDASQVVHRLVPLVREMRLNTVCSFVSCVVFQACIISLHSCSWWPSKDNPRRALAAVNNVQQGLDFLEYVVPRWGFAGVLTTSLRSLIVERGFGMQESRGNSSSANYGAGAGAQSQNQSEEPVSDRSKSSAASPAGPNDTSAGNDQPLSAERMRPFLEESQWERILRTGEMPCNMRDGSASCALDPADNTSPSPLPCSPANMASSQDAERKNAFLESGSRRSFETPVLDFVHKRLFEAEQRIPKTDSKERNKQQPSNDSRKE